MNLFHDTDALLISNPTNIRYLIGFIGAAPQEREAYLLLTPDAWYLFTNILYLEYAHTLEKPAHIATYEIIQISRDTPLSHHLRAICQNRKITSLGYEGLYLSTEDYLRLKHKLPSVRFKPSSTTLDHIRSIKTHDELEKIRAACTITDACFAAILTQIKPGVTEKQIAWHIESFIRTHGAELSFPSIVAFGKNTSMPHYNTMKNSVLERSDIVLLDFGAKIDGYCADMTRMVFVGKPMTQAAKAYDATLKAQDAAFHYLQRNKPPVSGAQVDSAARTVLEKAGLPAYQHSLGHGIGLDIHESPRLTIQHDQTLHPGMTFTIEPGVYQENQYGIRIEDLVLLKEDGLEILSHAPKELLILHSI